MTAAVEVAGLRKSYGSIEAVRGIDLTVGHGEVFALLGPNGAGKTTTVEILEGHRRRDGGAVRVLGFDPERGGTAYRSRIGIVLQEVGVENYLTVAEVVEMVRGYYPNPLPLDEVLALVGMTDERDTRVSKLSGGKHRRLDVAVGIAGRPDMLFLDEPTTGFDPAARRGAWDMVRNLRDLGTTVFLTTHYMDEAQSLADRAAIIVGGRIVAEGAPAALAGRSTATRIRFRLPDGAPALPKALAQAAIIGPDGLEIETDDPTRVLNGLTGWAVRKKLELLGLTVARATLEEVYLELTGTEAVEG